MNEIDSYIYIYTLTQVQLEVLVNLRYLYQDKGNRGKRTLKIYPKLSKLIIYRHAKITVADKTVNHTKHNHGRPRKISSPDKRLIFVKYLKFERNIGLLV